MADIILEKVNISDYSNDLDLNNSMNNNIYAEPENSNIEYNESIPIEDNKSYNSNYMIMKVMVTIINNKILLQIHKE